MRRKFTQFSFVMQEFAGIFFARWVFFLTIPNDFLRFAIRAVSVERETNTNLANPHESFLYLLSYAPNVERKRKNVSFLERDNRKFYVYIS